MPCDSTDNYDDFMFYLSKLLQIIDEFSSPYIFLCGDFNANIQRESRFGKKLVDMCDANSLCISDKILLPADTHNFISASHATTSWLDHILTSTSGHTLIQNAHVMNDFISDHFYHFLSDHLPLCFNIVVDNVTACFTVPSSGMDNNLSSYNWRSANDQVLHKYKLNTKSSLSEIVIPFAALQCNDMTCTTHRKDIDQFYYSIVNIVNGCIKQCIPLHRHSPANN